MTLIMAHKLQFKNSIIKQNQKEYQGHISVFSINAVYFLYKKEQHQQKLSLHKFGNNSCSVTQVECCH